MIRHLLSALLLALTLAAPAAAQRAYAPDRLDVVARIDRLCPGLILRDHDFTDAVATALHSGAVLAATDAREAPITLTADRRWGRNGKRGNASDPSHDAIAYVTTASPFGVAVIDIIVAAGSPGARPAWIDQTDATILAKTTGVWIPPSGRLPACLTGAGPAPDPGSGPPPPPPSIDLTAVVQALERLSERVAALERRPAPEPVDVGLLNAFVDDMIGNGPGDGDEPNHVTDMKERLDKNRALDEQILALLQRLSSSPIFRLGR